MKLSKILLATAAALALAACGGGSGGDSNDDDNNGDDKNVSHLYYTLDYAPGGDFLSAHTVLIPHGADSGEFKLGNSTIKFSDDDDTLVVEGYRYLAVGDDFSADEGGLLLCKDDGPDTPIWHAILPAHAAAVAMGDRLNALIQAQRFVPFEACAPIDDEVFVFQEDGSVRVQIDGDWAPDEITRENVEALLSAEGWTRDEEDEDDGEISTVSSWIKVYTDEGGRVFFISINREEPKEGGTAEFDIMVMVQEEDQGEGTLVDPV